MSILFFILACYGLTMIIVQSKIMEPVREFFAARVKFIYQLLHCMMCTGFWVGFLGSIYFHYSPSYALLNGTGNTIPYHFFDGAFISVYSNYSYTGFSGIGSGTSGSSGSSGTSGSSGDFISITFPDDEDSDE